MKNLNHPFKNPIKKIIFSKKSYFLAFLIGSVFLLGWFAKEKGQSLALQALQPTALTLQNLVKKTKSSIQRQEQLEKGGLPGLKAQLVFFDPATAAQTLWINQGSEQGVQVGDVITAEGALVGRVVEIQAKRAQVLLITDLRSVVAVQDESSSAQGLLVGKRLDLSLDRTHWLTQAEYFEAKEEIKLGDRLVTSGLDALFPKGIPAGIVREVKKDSHGLFWQASVEPIADIKKITEVEVFKQSEDL